MEIYGEKTDFINFCNISCIYSVFLTRTRNKRCSLYFFIERFEEISGIYSSLAGAAGRVYFVGRNGVTYVLKASEKFKVLAVNKLQDKIDCSPAFVGDEMYLKGKENLYCLTESK
jgi:hypothetical protein